MGGMSYTKVSAGGGHTLLLCSDGCIVPKGNNSEGQCIAPKLDSAKEVKYTDISCGGVHSVLLRSDGHAIAIGCNANGQCSLPEDFDSSSFMARTCKFSIRSFRDA